MRKTVRFCVIMFLLAAMALIATVPQSQASVVAGPVANPANGHFYYLLSNSTWEASEAEAVTLGGHLATIRSQAENDWVYNTFSTYSGGRRDLWIGLNDPSGTGAFAWSSGEASAYNNWNSGEPDNTGTERYVFIYNPASATPQTWGNTSAATATPNGVAEVIKTLSSLAITAGPASVYQISQASYTATATFDDSSTAVVTATWSVNPTTYASIDSGGILTTKHVPSDQSITITASFTTGGVTKTATKDVTITQVQTPGMVYFFDDFENGLGKWVVSGSDWDVIDDDARSGTHCITDSPEGNYPNSANASLTLRSSIDLSGANNPILSFWHKYSVENDGYQGVDYIYVELSQDGGLTWPVILSTFNGNVSIWTQEQVDLTPYKSGPIKIRFRLRANDDGDIRDGWYVDDVAISEKDTASTAFPFFDNFENGLANWSISGRDWALIDTDYRSAGHSITDSPSGVYPVSSNATLSLAHPINLSATTSPRLSFWHKYSIENDGYQGVDYAFVELSQDGGLTWSVIASFNGNVSTWTQELVDLTPYKSGPIKIRFRLRATDDGNIWDGWYIDDVSISEENTASTGFPFFDNFENGLANWSISGRDWALIDTDYRSAGHSITDSPSGVYPVSSNATLSLAHPINLSATTSPRLSFWHKYSIENDGYQGVDYAFVELSQDGGLTWFVIATFNGNVSTWTQELVDLTPYKSGPIKIRFRLRATDDGNIWDGWYIDDVAIYDNDGSAPVPGTVTPSNTANGSYVSGTFDLSTLFTDNQSRVTECQYSTNGGTTWSDAVVSGSGPTNNCTKTGITGTNGQVLTLNMQATSVGGTAFGSEIQVTVDAQPPTNGSLTIAPDDTKLNLSWSGFSDSASGLRAANTYKVVRSSTAIPDAYCTNGTQVYLGNALTYQNTGLTNRTTYYYRVCAYDNVGNISSGATGNETPVPHHNLTINIIGGGTVNDFDPSPPSMPPCSSPTCTTPFLEGSHFLLRGSPAVSFIGWSGAGCSEGDCSITLTGDKAVTAAFTSIVKIEPYDAAYQSLQSAYDSAVSLNRSTPELRARNFEVDGDFSLNSPIYATLKGGYTDSTFTTATGYSTIKGVLTITEGSLAIDRLIVK